MESSILLALGGIGLFLFGMIVLTDGLRALTGDALRRMLAKMTKSPGTGVLAGALTTAVIQSSSATTVTTVGFVGAGLLTFPQALGIVLGANIGTTITGWMVAILGFKLQIGAVALPLMLGGALLTMFGKGRLRDLGRALAGFSLLFIGIEAMRDGMAALEGYVTPGDFPGDTLFARLQLVAIGVGITLVTQSSSAGIAAALVALGAGAITLPQGAAMVIGMDVGTTFSAFLATVGGSTAMRRTGYAHVIFNVFAASIAFTMLTPFVWIVEWLTPQANNSQILLVAFHTALNVFGVLLVLPFANSFVRVITRIAPVRGMPLLRKLDRHLLADPAASTDAAGATIKEIAFSLLRGLSDLLGSRDLPPSHTQRLHSVTEALEETNSFIEKIQTAPPSSHYHRHLAIVHVLDHLRRLHHRCTQNSRIATLRSEARLRRLSGTLHGAVIELLDTGDIGTAEKRLARLRDLFQRQSETYRGRTVEAAALHRIGEQVALERLDSVRWLHRVAYHLWRILHHLRQIEETSLPDHDTPPAGTSSPQATQQADNRKTPDDANIE